MLETLSIICMIFVIGYFVTESAKGVGRKISRLAAPHSGCKAFMSDDSSHYVISYMGPNSHIEHEWIEHIYENGYWNIVSKLEYDGKTFKAQIKRKDYKDNIFKTDVAESHSLKKLKEVIEKKFKEWNFEEQLRINEEWAKRSTR